MAPNLARSLEMAGLAGVHGADRVRAVTQPHRTVETALVEVLRLPAGLGTRSSSSARCTARAPAGVSLGCAAAAAAPESNFCELAPEPGADRYLVEKVATPPKPWPRRTALALSMRAPFGDFRPAGPPPGGARPRTARRTRRAPRSATAVRGPGSPSSARRSASIEVGCVRCVPCCVRRAGSSSAHQPLAGPVPGPGAASASSAAAPHESATAVASVWGSGPRGQVVEQIGEAVAHQLQLGLGHGSRAALEHLRAVAAYVRSSVAEKRDTGRDQSRHRRVDGEPGHDGGIRIGGVPSPRVGARRSLWNAVCHQGGLQMRRCGPRCATNGGRCAVVDGVPKRAVTGSPLVGTGVPQRSGPARGSGHSCARATVGAARRTG